MPRANDGGMLEDKLSGAETLPPADDETLEGTDGRQCEKLAA